MKFFLSSLLAFGLAAATAHAQSTMPAIGANTPKGEVAKTDASINQAGSRTNASSKTKGTANKRMRKTKMKATKPTDTM